MNKVTLLLSVLATMDVDGIRKLLGFTDKQLPIMNNPVGYKKK